MHLILFGTGFYGRVDQTPGVVRPGRSPEVLHIATEFFYISGVPLIPFGSYAVVAPSGLAEQISLTFGFGEPSAAMPISMNLKSVVLGYIRAILCWALVICGFAGVVLTLEGSAVQVGLSALGISASSGLLLWLSYLLARAGPARARELKQLLGKQTAMRAEIVVLSQQPLGYARSALENDIEEMLGGSGVVTGGCSGRKGWNIDIALAEGIVIEDKVNCLATFLQGRVPLDTYLHVLPPGYVAGQPSQRVEVFGKQER